jgi:hypothetical protein
MNGGDMTTLDTEYDPATGILRTRLQGVVDADDVRTWAAGLRARLAAIPDGRPFKLMVDLIGYEPRDIAAHKEMRLEVPYLLARHGLRSAYADLYPEEPEVEVSVERGVYCVACANVHHDPVKMGDYEARIATPKQRFFTDRGQAEIWLNSLPLQTDVSQRESEPGTLS